jgi:hypothetical protein
MGGMRFARRERGDREREGQRREREKWRVVRRCEEERWRLERGRVMEVVVVGERERASRGEGRETSKQHTHARCLGKANIWGRSSWGVYLVVCERRARPFA